MRHGVAVGKDFPKDLPEGHVGVNLAKRGMETDSTKQA